MLVSHFYVFYSRSYAALRSDNSKQRTVNSVFKHRSISRFKIRSQLIFWYSTKYFYQWQIFAKIFVIKIQNFLTFSFLKISKFHFTQFYLVVKKRFDPKYPTEVINIIARQCFSTNQKSSSILTLRNKHYFKLFYSFSHKNYIFEFF